MTAHVPAGPAARRPELLVPTRLLAVAGSLSEAVAAVRAGADLVELSGLPDSARPAGLPDQAGPARLPDQARPARLPGLAEPLGLAARSGLAGDAVGELIGQFRALCPGVLVGGSGPAADLVRDPAVARATGALLICASPAAAQAAGQPASRVIVEVTPGGVAATAQAGWATLVDADQAAGLASSPERRPDPGPAELGGVVAAAALACWLGATLVRTRHVRPVRRGLDMAASIRGARPPARTLRGLA